MFLLNQVDVMPHMTKEKQLCNVLVYSKNKAKSKTASISMRLGY